VDGSKETELVMAVLLYAVRCLLEGDQAALRDMNFGPKEIDALREMKLADLCGVESMRAHCLEIALNRDVYWPMIAHLKARRASEELQQQLMAADASLEMMQTLFGMSAREYTRLRRMLTVSPAIGRPPEPDDDASARLWEAWRASAKSEEPTAPEVYLRLHKETGLPLRVVWNQVQRWSTYGALDPIPSTRAR
tara:strand:- start:10797 stop:11378 length:582 start_codon:yes stop_codon:yes gene_type:complete